MTLLYGRTLLDTLHERVGEEEDQRQRPNPENGKLGWGADHRHERTSER